MQDVIGVDLGGTWMRAARVTAAGNCGEIFRSRTGRRRSSPSIIHDLAALIRRCVAGAAGADIAGVGLGLATTLDTQGRLMPSDNLPSLSGCRLDRDLEHVLRAPVRLANDADCFTMGEWRQGAGKGTRNFCGLTLGTGLGVGLVLEGRLYQGSHGWAGEIWKSPWEGGRLEDGVCGPALERAYTAQSGRQLDGAVLTKLAERGDACARDCFSEFGRRVGRVLAWIVNLIDPERVAIGGSLAAAFPLFRKPLLQALADGSVAGGRVRIQASRLGDRAALLGAAQLFRDRGAGALACSPRQPRRQASDAAEGTSVHAGMNRRTADPGPLSARRRG